MSKAEERALKLYTTPSCGQFGTGDYEPPEVDVDSVKAYIQGYEQAEKDLELTWEDIRDICSIQYIVLNEYNDYDESPSNILYQEVLKRFNEERKK